MDDVTYVLHRDGAIMGWSRCAPGFADTLANGHAVIEISAPPPADISAWFVQDGGLVARAAMAPVVSTTEIVADGVATAEISALPDPCAVRIDGVVSLASTPVAGGQVTLACTSIGDLRIEVTAPGYLPWRATIRAV